MNENRFLTPPEIAVILGFTAQSVQDWITKGRLKTAKVGNKNRVWPEWLIEYLQGLGNPPEAMARFKVDIENFLAIKYNKAKEERR